jgi:hypothetical protein
MAVSLRADFDVLICLAAILQRVLPLAGIYWL